MISERAATDKNKALEGRSDEPQGEPSDQEVSKVREWMQLRRLAELASVRTEQPDAMARLCLEMADAHPDEVTTLLWNQGIAEQALSLLTPQKSDGVDDTSLTALAQCVLSAGHAMDRESDDKHWPAGVRELLLKRRADRRTYWQSKATKFQQNPPKDPLKVLPPQQRPFFFRNEGYSTQHLNGVLSVPLQGGVIGRSGDTKFSCRHFAQAAQDRTKDFFKRISQSDTSSLKYLELGRSYEISRRRRERRSVQFALGQFGRLLVHIANLVPRGESRSYALNYLSSGQLDLGHEMRLFVANRPSVSEGTRDAPQMALKIGVYEPNVTGNMKHLRVLHEDLPRLSIDDFVLFSFEEDWGVQVLSVELDDPELALALAGRFIPAEVEIQLSSFMNALASGNLNEMKAVRRAITRDDFQGLNPRREQLSRALCYALDYDHTDSMLELIDLLPVLDQATIETIALARVPGGQPRLAHALERQRFSSVRAYGQILLAMGKRLPQSIWLEALEANSVRMVNGRTWKLPCLHRAMWANQHETVSAILTMFKDLRPHLSKATISHLLMSVDEEGTCGVARALDADATSSFQAFVGGNLACNPSASTARALLVQAGMRLKKFIDDQDRVVAGTIMQMVIAVQEHPHHRLPKPDALEMRRTILRACKQPLCIFPCLWVERSAYKRLCNDRAWLNQDFEDALRLLKP